MTGIQNDYRRLPDNEKTAAASLEAVTADPANLRHVPVRNLTYEVITAALEADPESLKILSERGHDEALVMKAVSVSGNSVLAYRTVLDELKTEKAYIAGLSAGFQSFLLVPKDRRTPDICLAAEKMYPDLFRIRPDALPENVRNGRNIFTFSRILEKATGNKYDYEALKSVYEGRPLAVSRFLAPEGVMKECTVRYDKEKGRFQYKNGIRELRKPNNRTPKLK